MKKFYILSFLLLTSICYSQSSCPGIDSLNYGSRWYHTIQIGSQCWLKENLNIGTQIMGSKTQSNNDTIEKYCYNDSISNCDVYGGLYQWRELVQYSLKNKIKGICPFGWHIPSDTEFDTLKKSVGGNGNALLEIGQGNGTNSTGFSALLAGGKDLTDVFYQLGSSTIFGISNSVMLASGGGSSTFRLYPYSIYILSNGTISTGNGPTTSVADYSKSVRCIKDSAGLFLQSPYGGAILLNDLYGVEHWQVNTIQKISWGGGNIYDIRIDYSTNNGTYLWINIIASVPFQNGSYNWTIPNTPSSNCRVRISDLINPDIYSISDKVFEIFTNPCPTDSAINYAGQKYHTLVIGNKCWFKENVNTGAMIQGNQTPVSNNTVEKYCYNNDSSNCSKYGGLYTFSEMNEPNFCPLYWHVPNYDNLFSSVMWDANSLKALGEGSDAGSGTNTSGFSALLAGYLNSTGSFIDLGVRAWFPFEYYIKPYKILVNYFEASNNLVTWADYFQPIQGGSARCVRDDIAHLSLKSPTGGENWLIDSTYKISWPYNYVTNIRIDYTTDNGLTWLNIIPSIPTSVGSYNWIIPNTPSANCLVKISSVSNPDTNCISSKVFRIYKVPITPCPGISSVEYDGQIYQTISIGDQCWMRENLNIGTMINVIQDPSNNGIIEKYCYNNDSTNCTKYGGLYQWSEAMLYDSIEGAKGICPKGWHIPTFNEFSSLITLFGNNGNELKEIGQGSSAAGIGTNASGFSALLGGSSNSGTFNGLGAGALFWRSTSYYEPASAYSTQLVGSNSIIYGSPINKIIGASIRCINDSSISALPIELTSFTASLINNNVKLNWSTATETNSSSFNIEKKAVNNNTWQNITSIKAFGTSTSSKQYSYIDKNVNTGKYNYRLKMIDLDGSSKYSNIITAEVTPPAKYELSNAYPNPWNPTTTIRYKVPVNILVTIKVFDALGRELTTLVNEVKPAGSYEVTLNGRNLASGIYYYQMKSGNFIATKKIILIK